MLGAVFGAISKLAATAIGKAVVGGAVSAIANNIGRKTTSPKIDLVGMRKDAEKAGFNPLSVMRYGGMGGYMVPAMSSQSFAGEFLGNVMTSGFDAWANQDIDKYNAQIRELELQQRRADLGYTRGLTGQISRPAMDPEPWMEEYYKNPDGFTEMLSFSGKQIEVKNSVLYRLRLRPGTLFGLAEDAEAILGEIGGELTGIGNFGDTLAKPIVEQSIPPASRPEGEITVPALSKRVLDALGKYSMNQSRIGAIYPF